MADASDVEQALVQAAAAALYPQGTQSAVSVTGAVIRVYRGWPTNAALESDLAAGICHVSVTGVAGAQPEVEQFPAAWEVPDPVAPALDAFATNGAVTFSGAATLGQLAGVLADDDGFAYRTRAGDSPEAVAANLAAAINTVRIATVTGASVNVPGAARLVGRVVADQVAVLLTRRQRGEFRLTCWCGDPVSRDAIAAAIDVALSQTPFIALPDSTAARLRGVRSESTDDLTTLPLYRRELVFSADYATTLVQTQPSMLIGIFSADDPRVAARLHLS